MHVDPASRELRVHFVLRQILIAAKFRNSHAEDVHWRGLPKLCNQIGAGDASTPERLVDDDCAVRYIAAVAVTWVRNAVIDHVGRHAPAIPKQLVKVRDVNDGNAPVVGHRVTHLVDDTLWNVVFEINGRQIGAGLRTEPLADEIEIRELVAE